MIWIDYEKKNVIEIIYGSKSTIPRLYSCSNGPKYLKRASFCKNIEKKRSFKNEFTFQWTCFFLFVNGNSGWKCIISSFNKREIRKMQFIFQDTKACSAQIQNVNELIFFCFCFWLPIKQLLLKDNKQSHHIEKFRNTFWMFYSTPEQKLVHSKLSWMSKLMSVQFSKWSSFGFGL